MALYRLEVKTIGRAQGRSAVAAAAYRAGERIRDERTGIEHDYERRRGVERSEVLLPRDAPERWRDRSELWNDAERAETRSNSRLAREYVIALPRELDAGERWECARAFAMESLVERGMCADVCVHDRGDGNPHAHILCTTREAGPGGFGGKVREWDDRFMVDSWREEWERRANESLERAYERRQTPDEEREYVDRRSNAERGLEREPERHEGPVVRAIERRERESCERDGREYSPVTDVARENAEIRERNALRERLLSAARDMARRARDAAERVREAARDGFQRAMDEMRGRDELPGWRGFRERSGEDERRQPARNDERERECGRDGVWEREHERGCEYDRDDEWERDR